MNWWTQERREEEKMRRDCQPHFVEDDGTCRKLHRFEFTDQIIREKFLQKELHRNPELLPVEEIDDVFAPLVSLGREIQAIDNLFISPTGRITIVETKLWRNPGATRQVVAQVLDYAKQLSKKSYEDFEKACRSAIQPAPLSKQSLYDLVSKQYPAEIQSEAIFTDAVQRNLRNARFMLLVVGDGIRENLEDILGLLHQQPQMLFTLGLVELQIYECDGLQGRLIVPQLVARTNEIVRAVVRVENPSNMAVSVTLPQDQKEKATTLSEQEFLDSVKAPQTRDLFSKLIAFAKDIGHVSCASQSLSSRIAVHDAGDIKLFRLTTRGDITPQQLDRQLKKRGLSGELAWDTARELTSLFSGVDLKPDRAGLTRRLTAQEVLPKIEEFMSIYRKAADRLKTMTPTIVPQNADEDDEDQDEKTM